MSHSNFAWQFLSLENNDFVSLWLLLLYYYLYCFSKIIVQNKKYSIWAHLFTTTLLHRTLSSKNDSHKKSTRSHIYNDTEKWDSYFMILFPYISVFFSFLVFVLGSPIEDKTCIIIFIVVPFYYIFFWLILYFFLFSLYNMIFF